MTYNLPFTNLYFDNMRDGGIAQMIFLGKISYRNPKLIKFLL